MIYRLVQEFADNMPPMAVNLKPVRRGGITRAAAARDVAESARLMTLVDEPLGGVMASACIATLASTVSCTRACRSTIREHGPRGGSDAPRGDGSP